MRIRQAFKLSLIILIVFSLFILNDLIAVDNYLSKLTLNVFFFFVISVIILPRSYFSVGILFFYALFSAFLGLSMTPVDAEKFYAQAFTDEGYYGEGHFSTVMTVGFALRLINYFFSSANPEILVLINYIFHGLTVLLIYKTISLRFKETPIIKDWKFCTFFFFLMLSPLILNHLPYLLKDFYSSFFVFLSIYFYQLYLLNKRKFYLFLVAVFLVVSALFRVYSPIYFLIFFLLLGEFRRTAVASCLVGLMLFINFFGSKSLMFIGFSLIGMFAIPNPSVAENWLEIPFSSLENLILLGLTIFTIIGFSLEGKWKILMSFLLAILLTAMVFSLISLYRISFSSYEFQGNYLADNFFRKKIVFLYIIYAWLAFSHILRKVR